MLCKLLYTTRIWGCVARICPTSVKQNQSVWLSTENVWTLVWVLYAFPNSPPVWIRLLMAKVGQSSFRTILVGYCHGVSASCGMPERNDQLVWVWMWVGYTVCWYQQSLPLILTGRSSLGPEGQSCLRRILCLRSSVRAISEQPNKNKKLNTQHRWKNRHSTLVIYFVIDRLFSIWEPLHYKSYISWYQTKKKKNLFARLCLYQIKADRGRWWHSTFLFKLFLTYKETTHS